MLSLGFAPSDKNLELLKALMENGSPLNKENLAFLNRAFLQTGSMEKALFLFINNIPPTSHNASLLDALINGQAGLTSMLREWLSAIETLPDNSIKNQLLHIINTPVINNHIQSYQLNVSGIPATYAQQTGENFQQPSSPLYNAITQPIPEAEFFTAQQTNQSPALTASSTVTPLLNANQTESLLNAPIQNNNQEFIPANSVSTD
ncbi:MAG: hypothetical protein FWE82_09505, partial [Defluviitaleaceae bacterium]|nr:hypothetical protein [Defluviitaleaceae bacterium]